MKMNLNQVEGTVKVGTIVQVDLSNVDRQKVEGNDLTLAVAEEEKGKGKIPSKHRLAFEKRKLKNLCARSYVKPTSNVNNFLMVLQGKCDS